MLSNSFIVFFSIALTTGCNKISQITGTTPGKWSLVVNLRIVIHYGFAVKATVILFFSQFRQVMSIWIIPI